MRGIYVGLWFSFLVASSSNYPRDSDFQPLSWNQRIKVAPGAAKGLAYLHSPEAKVIYRDSNFEDDRREARKRHGASTNANILTGT
ncbi:hypothetical protein RJ640_002748 [Escallonia rubra]|uniref:Secreted protein n=1 Tax=Escallonia rubra TaxID=112253 RepID=A0AA88S3P7_9ASTE|nr:hypothetical protein RJ640_002748 [Escallonia rubra]